MSARAPSSEVDRNGLEVLSNDACLRLIEAASIGRVALSIDALPVVVPVNFSLLPEGILIRTGAGPKLEAACDNAVVAFEVDDFDATSHSGWSVLVQGRARLVTDMDGGHGPVPASALESSAPPSADHLVTIALDRVTGRRLNG